MVVTIYRVNKCDAVCWNKMFAVLLVCLVVVRPTPLRDSIGDVVTLLIMVSWSQIINITLGARSRYEEFSLVIHYLSQIHLLSHSCWGFLITLAAVNCCLHLTLSASESTTATQAPILYCFICFICFPICFICLLISLAPPHFYTCAGRYLSLLNNRS